MKYLVSIPLTLLVFICNAQFAKNGGKIHIKPNDEAVISLADSIKLSIGVQEEGWYPASFKAYVLKSAVNGDSILAADTELVNDEKENIGQSLGEIKVTCKAANKRGFHKYYEILVTGFIKGTNLHYRSIPEKGLEEILNDGKVAGRMERLEAYFRKLGFTKETFEGYTAWVYLDEAGSLEQPHYRCIVIFRGETALYCIVSKSELMTLDKLKDQRDHRTGKYYFYQRPSDRNWEEIKDIVYGFIPL